MKRAHEMSTFETKQETILLTARIFLWFSAYFLIIHFAVIVMDIKNRMSNTGLYSEQVCEQKSEGSGFDISRACF